MSEPYNLGSTRRLIVNKRHIYQRRPNKRGILHEDYLDVKGREKRSVQSFQCSVMLWLKFRRMVESKYGKYKQSYVIEDLIRKWIQKQEDMNDEKFQYR